jgi:spore maturation protein SpmA
VEAEALGSALKYFTIWVVVYTILRTIVFYTVERRVFQTLWDLLGLSNAATPLGLKAMEELNKLNPKAGTATNAMITFLTINTGGLILIPATAIAVRAVAGSANPGIIIGTSIFGASCATVAGVCAAKLLQRLPRYRKELEPDAGKEASHE